MPRSPRCWPPSTPGEVDLGFVAIENSIEGTVNVTIDTLAFEHDLLIQREVVLGIQQHLMAPPGVGLADITPRPHHPGRRRRSAAACWRGELPGVEVVAANSTAEAARAGRPRPTAPRPRDRPRLGRQDLRARGAGRGHRGPPREPDPLRGRRPRGRARRRRATTRPRSSCSSGPTSPAPCWPSSRSSRPGRINLTKLESRPTKKAPRRLLLHHRPRGPHRRRGRRRLPPGPPHQGRRREVPRLVPRRRRARPRRPAARPRPPGAKPTPGSPPSTPSSAPDRAAPKRECAMLPDGTVAEWTKATALKVVDPQGFVGSNPTRSRVVCTSGWP